VRQAALAPEVIQPPDDRVGRRVLRQPQQRQVRRGGVPANADKHDFEGYADRAQAPLAREGG
jgi:hypothetical protein